MRAQDAYDLSVSNSKVQLENVLKQIKRAAEEGAFRYLEYKTDCSEMTVKSLIELGYRIEQDASLVKINWDLQSICKTNQDCSIDN